jgi:hypothetical protein
MIARLRLHQRQDSFAFFAVNNFRFLLSEFSLLHCGKLLLKTEIAPENFPNHLSTQPLSARFNTQVVGLRLYQATNCTFH